MTQQELDEAQRQGVPINPQLAVRSPIAGVVVQKLVSPGLVIQAGMTACFTISDVSTVWVQGHIYDRDLESIHVGDTVEQTNASFPQTFRGTVAYIGALIDPATRTTPVRIVTQNPAGRAQKGHVPRRDHSHQIRPEPFFRFRPRRSCATTRTCPSCTSKLNRDSSLSAW